MIRFTEKLDKTEGRELSEQFSFKEIKPILKTLDSSSEDFWDDVFCEENHSDEIYFSDEEIISEIYECDPSKFQFDINIDDKSIQECLSEFDSNKWDNLDDTQKIEIVERFKVLLCEKLDINEIPPLVIFKDEKNICGAYNGQSNTLELNRNILDNPKEVIDTIAHETMHAYQYQQACIGETRQDILYAINFLNYIEPIQIDGNYINFNEYQNQLLEVEARTFAGIFRN